MSSQQNIHLAVSLRFKKYPKIKKYDDKRCIEKVIDKRDSLEKAIYYTCDNSKKYYCSPNNGTSKSVSQLTCSNLSCADFQQMNEHYLKICKNENSRYCKKNDSDRSTILSKFNKEYFNMPPKFIKQGKFYGNKYTSYTDSSIDKKDTSMKMQELLKKMRNNCKFIRSHYGKNNKDIDVTYQCNTDIDTKANKNVYIQIKSDHISRTKSNKLPNIKTSYSFCENPLKFTNEYCSNITCTKNIECSVPSIKSSEITQLKTNITNVPSAQITNLETCPTVSAELENVNKIRECSELPYEGNKNYSRNSVRHYFSEPKEVTHIKCESKNKSMQTNIVKKSNQSTEYYPSRKFRKNIECTTPSIKLKRSESPKLKTNTTSKTNVPTDEISNQETCPYRSNVSAEIQKVTEIKEYSEFPFEGNSNHSANIVKHHYSEPKEVTHIKCVSKNKSMQTNIVKKSNQSTEYYPSRKLKKNIEYRTPSIKLKRSESPKLKTNTTSKTNVPTDQLGNQETCAHISNISAEVQNVAKIKEYSEFPFEGNSNHSANTVKHHYSEPKEVTHIKCESKNKSMQTNIVKKSNQSTEYYPSRKLRKNIEYRTPSIKFKRSESPKLKANTTSKTNVPTDQISNQETCPYRSNVSAEIQNVTEIKEYSEFPVEGNRMHSANIVKYYYSEPKEVTHIKSESKNESMQTNILKKRNQSIEYCLSRKCRTHSIKFKRSESPTLKTNTTSKTNVPASQIANKETCSHRSNVSAEVQNATKIKEYLEFPFEGNRNNPVNILRSDNDESKQVITHIKNDSISTNLFENTSKQYTEIEHMKKTRHNILNYSTNKEKNAFKNELLPQIEETCSDNISFDKIENNLSTYTQLKISDKNCTKLILKKLTRMSVQNYRTIKSFKKDIRTFKLLNGFPRTGLKSNCSKLYNNFLIKKKINPNLQKFSKHLCARKQLYLKNSPNINHITIPTQIDIKKSDERNSAIITDAYKCDYILTTSQSQTNVDSIDKINSNCQSINVDNFEKINTISCFQENQHNQEKYYNCSSLNKECNQLQVISMAADNDSPMVLSVCDSDFSYMTQLSDIFNYNEIDISKCQQIETNIEENKLTKEDIINSSLDTDLEHIPEYHGPACMKYRYERLVKILHV